MEIKERQTCRICEGTLNTVLDLGEIYPSNFVTGDEKLQKAPLVLTKCNSCGLVQLKHTVELDSMYRQYWYRSGLNPSMVKDLQDVVYGVENHVNIEEGDVILDIGCFPENVEISLADGGSKPISEIKENDLVISANNNIKKVIKTFNRNYDGKLITIKFGKETLSATEEHPILAFTDNIDNKKFIPIKDLNLGDYIVLPRHNNQSIDESLSDLYFIYGWYLAEGNIIYSHKPKVCGINLTLCIDEEAYIAQLEDAAKRLGFNTGKSVRPEKSIIELRIYSKVFAEEILRLFGKGAKHKFIAPEVFNLPENLRKILLRNYFRGDGCIRLNEKAYQYYVSTRSRQLSIDIKRMLVQLGAFPNTYEYHKDEIHMYALTLCGTDVNVLEDIVTYKSKSKKIVTEEYVAVPIKSIEIEKVNIPVFNFEVEDDNSYIANLVGVHNCNDGTMLGLYEEVGRIKVGIDPANNLKEKALKNCDHFINDYFTAQNYNKLGLKKAKVITSIAMFYDLEDPKTFVNDIKETLHEDGIWVVQFTDLLSMLSINAFDNICHEHLEYWSLGDITRLLNEYDLAVFDVSYNKVNGGSLRVYICHRNRYTPTAEFYDAIVKEYAFLAENTLETFAETVEILKNTVTDLIWDLYSKDNSIALLSASTKGNTLLQYFNLVPPAINHAAEVNEDKFGLKTVGTNIPIISQEDSMKLKPDYYFIPAWHFLNDFIERMGEYLDNGGKFIVPMPYPSIISKDKEGKLWQKTTLLTNLSVN